MKELQLPEFFPLLDDLQLQYGDRSLRAVYGAGCLENPSICMIFMNPTGRTLSTLPDWQGIRAPWVGTKNIWRLFYGAGVISARDFEMVSSYKPADWTPEFAMHMYEAIAVKRVYVTSLGKCSQLDARPLPDRVFQAYLQQTYDEVFRLKPKCIVTFGNQVSSIFLQKKISVSAYAGVEHEELLIQNAIFRVFPAYYPVGLGLRNISYSIARVKSLLSL